MKYHIILQKLLDIPAFQNISKIYNELHVSYESIFYTH